MIFEKIEYPNLDEVIYSGIHESGLKIVLMPKKFTKSYAVIGTRYGSANDCFVVNGRETCVPDGIAHYLEHKLFEKPDGTNAFDDYAMTGASANAYTGFNNTCYLFSCTDKLKENLEILLSFVMDPYFTEENVDKERGIITQEIRMYDDEPGWCVYFNLLKAMYSKMPIRKDIAGTAESIQEITPQLLYDCYNAFYNPKNMIMFIVGDIEDKDSIVAIVDKYVKNSGAQVPEGVFPEEPVAVSEKYHEEKMSVPTPLFMMGFKEKSNGIDGKELLKKQIITEILMEMLFGKSSDLYQNLYNSGLINDSFGSEFNSEKMYGHTIISGESPDPVKVKDEIVDYLAKAQLDEADFNRSQKALMGHFLHGLNSVENIGHEFISSLFTNVNVLDYTQICSEITFDEAVARFEEHFDEEQMSLSVVLPHEK